jgi:hypothetical protein
MTVLGGTVVHATDEFASHAPPPLPVMPDWSPAHRFGGYGAPKFYASAADSSAHPSGCACPAHRSHPIGCACPAHAFNASSVLARLLGQASAPADRALGGSPNGFFGVGCDCFAF